MVALADVVRGESVQYLQTRRTTREQRKAMYDIMRCRTEAMGSVGVVCEQCHMEYRLFRSCRNRSCPQCQKEARAKWLEARLQELLPVPYSHVVFCAPAELKVLAQYCPEELYDAVIRAAGQAIIDVGRSEFGAQLGCQVQLQTWTQSIAYHLHVHCVVPCGGFSEGSRRWVSFEPGALSIRELWRSFRAHLCKLIRTAAQKGNLNRLPETVPVETLLARVMRSQKGVYAKPPYGGPEQLLGYLAQYTYRVAITDERIETYENRQVTFRWRDYRHGNKEKRCTLEGQEFVRRFLMHVPPRGFVRVRSYGFMGNRNRKANLERARHLIGNAGARPERAPFKPRRLCPACSGRNERTLHIVHRPGSDLSRPPPHEPYAA